MSELFEIEYDGDRTDGLNTVVGNAVGEGWLVCGACGTLVQQCNHWRGRSMTLAEVKAFRVREHWKKKKGITDGEEQTAG